MKQALSPEVPARVRRGQFRALYLGIGTSLLAAACSFGQVDKDADIDPVNVDPSTESDDPTTDDETTTVDGNPDDSDPATPPRQDNDPNAPDPNAPAPGSFDGDDPFSSEEGRIVREILEVNCGNCHVGQGASGDFGYLFDIQQLMDNGKVIPGSKEDSQLYTRMVGGTMPPAAVRVKQTPTYGQIEVVGKWIDELELPDPDGACEPQDFLDVDSQIELMAEDMASLDATDQIFTRYLTINYTANAGDCKRAVQRARYGLFKGVNSVSTGTIPVQPEAIDADETIYRIDIRDYNWDRDIDLEDDGVVDFTDAWEAIVADPRTNAFQVEYAGDQADDLKADAGTAIPFMPVNVFIQATEFGNLYYALIEGRENLFDFELEVLNIDTAAEIEDNNFLRAGFANSGVSKQERVLNRFDSGVAANLNYWISFDFDGGNGGDGANGFEQNVANESIFADPLGFNFAGGEAIFSLPNGLQAYYVAAADGTRLATAPIGVVIDPAQNNGLVTNGASCHSCHNIGLITFTDAVRQYVIDNKFEFDNDTFEDVMESYPEAAEFQRVMDLDSDVHLNAAERAGVPRGTPDPISRIYLDFQLGNISTKAAAGELGVTEAELVRNINLLDPRLAPLGDEGGFVDRNIFADTFFDAVCILQSVQTNGPVGCVQ
jgi:serine/threonine-protein kinase